MSQQEIRWWLTELRRRGWGTRVLGRTVGLRNPHCVMAKADGRQWIYPREQIRMSRQIKRILSGELVCKPGRAGRPDRHGDGPGKAVLAEHPVPLVPPNKRVLDVDLLFRRGAVRFKLVPAYEPPALKVPDFEALRRKLRDG
jgi:hypothetical protein